MCYHVDKMNMGQRCVLCVTAKRDDRRKVEEKTRKETTKEERSGLSCVQLLCRLGTVE